MYEQFRGPLEEFAQGLVRSMRDELKAGGYNASGELSRSLQYEVRVQPYLQVFVEANEYWQWVGNGRGPGKQPPIEPLVRWAKRKGLATDDKEARSIAWAIARNMAKRGSRDRELGGQNFALKVLERSREEEDRMLDAMLEVIDQGAVERFNAAFGTRKFRAVA